MKRITFNRKAVKSAALLLLAAALALFARDGVQAISREEDLVRNIGELFRAPSTFPPNNALRPAVGGTDIESGERIIQPLEPDEGPGEDRAPDHAPARFYPFMAAIVEDVRSPQQSYICAGSLIAPQWVLTAAHCTFSWTRRWPFDPEPYVLFKTKKLSEPGPSFAVTRVVTHPDYDARTLKNDIALLRIDTKGEKLGPPIRLEGPPIREQVGEIAHILGWGVTNRTLLERQKSESLQLIQVAVRDEICFAGAHHPRLRGTGAFCATSLFRHHDICYRFGGGPVGLYDPQGRRYLAGLVSWPAVCPSPPGSLNVFSDVQHYVPWIKSVIESNGGPR